MQQLNLTSVKYWFSSQNTLLFIMLQHATFHDNNKKQMKLYNYIVFVFVLAVITAFSLKWWLMFFTNSDFKEEAQTYMEQLNLGKSIDKTFNWLKQQIDLNQGKLYERRKSGHCTNCTMFTYIPLILSTIQIVKIVPFFY